MRIKIIRIIIIGLFLTIALNLIYVQVIRGRYFYHLSTNNRIRIVPLEGWRGKIKDRNGTVLADSRVAYNVMVAPQGIDDRKELFRFLGEVLEIDQTIIEKRYLNKKLAPFAPVVIAEDVPRNKAIIIEESKSRLGMNHRPPRLNRKNSIRKHEKTTSIMRIILRIILNQSSGLKDLRI